MALIRALPKTLLSLAMAALLVGGAFGCISVNMKQPPITAIETVYANELVFEGTQATINVSYISGGKFKEQMRLIRDAGYMHIHLDVYSGGGGIFDMNIVLTELQRFKEDGGTVTSHASGLIGSAAVPIYLMGDYRTMDRNAFTMIHPHSLHGKSLDDFVWEEIEEGNPTDRTLFINASHYITHYYAKLVADKTNVTYDEALEYLTTGDSSTGQWWFTAIEAYDMGFADELI